MTISIIKIATWHGHNKLKATVRSITIGVSAALILQGAGIGLRYLMQVMLARWFSTEDYGFFSVSIAIIQIVSAIAGFGLGTTALRVIPESLSKKDTATANGFLSASRLVVGITGITFGLLTMLFALWRLTDDIISALMVGVLVPVTALITIQTEFTRSFRRVVAAYGPSLILLPAMSTFLAYFLMPWRNSERALVGAFLGASIVVLVAQLAIIRLTMKQEGIGSERKMRSREWFRITFPLFLVTAFVMTLTQVDIIIVGLLKGPVQAGYYTAAAKTAGLVGVGLVAINAVVAPHISHLFHSGSRERLRRIVHLATLASATISLLAFLTLLILGGRLLTLFGDGFTIAFAPLAILGAAQLINGAVGPVGYMLSLTGHQKKAALIYGAAVVIDVGLNVVLIPRFGITGAAFSTAATVVFWNAWMYIAVLQNHGFSTIPFRRGDLSWNS